MKRLHISETLSLPAEVITQTFAVLAMRRVGKTYTASVMAEEMIKAKLPFVALDPTGAWWGLRSSADGKRAGYPVIIIGGEHGDLPLEPTAGKVLADLVVDHPGYYVLDMSSTLSNAEQDRIATDFAERLYRRKANAPFPLHLFVDEADSFIPQRPFPNQTKMLGAFEALVRRGGIRGIGMTMITQRPAVINKNVLTQCDNLVVLRITGTQDRDAIDDWVRGNGTKEQRDELVGSLASLQKGDAWIWSPAALDLFERVHVRERETFNSSATPEVGSSRVEPRELADVDLDALRDKISETIEKAKQEDPKELRSQIANLKKELSCKVEPAPPEIQRVEVPVIDHATIKELKDAILALEDQAQQVISALGEVKAALVKAEPGNRPPERAGQQTERRITTQAASRKEVKSSVDLPARRERKLDPEISKSNGRLPEGERKILIALAQYPDGCSRDQLSILTGYKRSSRDTYIQRLRVRGYASQDGSLVVATDDGADALGDDFEPLPTGAALQTYWLDRLPEGERKVLEVLLIAYPRAVGREEIDEETGYKRSSRDTYIQRLRARKLVEATGRAEVKASSELFD